MRALYWEKRTNPGEKAMNIVRKNRAMLNILLVIVLMALSLLASTFVSDAASELEAKGHVNCSVGAILRSKATTKSEMRAVLQNGSVVEIKKEVFTSKKKSSRTYKWYKVNTGAGEGYIRSDLIKVDSYQHMSMKTSKKIAYRSGAGKKMKKKGNLKKNAAVTVVMEAKAKGSAAVWYRIKKGSKYYYVKKSCLKKASSSSGTTPVPKPTTPTTPATPKPDPATTVVQSAEALRVVNGACAWAVTIAGDNRFHYGLKPMSQHNGCYYCNTQTLVGGRSKLGVNDYEFSYCCNPFVHAAFAHGGKEKTMLQVCQRGTSYDFHKGRGYDNSPLFAKLGKPAMSNLKKGDVICFNNHVMLYIGGGKIAEAAGGDDNVPYSDSWNNSIRVCTLSATRYAKAYGVFRYVGNAQ